MTVSWHRVWPAIIAVAGLQTAVLGWILAERIAILEKGREVILPIVPVDPRSLFRGDYVHLSYEVTRVPGHLFEGKIKAGELVYVTIERQAEGSYKPVAVSRKHPGVAAADQVVLQGRLAVGRRNIGANGQDLILRYGVESYFIPEGTGLELERMARDRKLAAVIAVDRNGKSAIKGLMVDGQLAYEEPLL